jgi:hypothetical protein
VSRRIPPPPPHLTPGQALTPLELLDQLREPPVEAHGDDIAPPRRDASTRTPGTPATGTDPPF